MDKRKDIAARLVANRERLARYMAGDRRSLDSWTHEEAEVKREEPAPKPDKQPDLAWLDQRIDDKLADFADLMGEMSGQSQAELIEKIREWRKLMCEQLRSDLIKIFGDDLNVMKDDVLAVLRAELNIKSAEIVDLPDFRGKRDAGRS